MTMLPTSPHLLIQLFYEAINERNVEKAMELIDEDCFYQDLNFTQPFQGKAAVEELLTESCQGLPSDLQFVIDDMTTGDCPSVGVLWHVELDGIPIPNGRGVSFCRISDATGKLIFVRDLVEPTIKPGKGAFLILRMITPLVRVLLKRVDSSKERATKKKQSSAAQMSLFEEDKDV